MYQRCLDLAKNLEFNNLLWKHEDPAHIVEGRHAAFECSLHVGASFADWTMADLRLMTIMEPWAESWVCMQPEKVMTTNDSRFGFECLLYHPDKEQFYKTGGHRVSSDKTRYKKRPNRFLNNPSLYTAGEGDKWTHQTAVNMILRLHRCMQIALQGNLSSVNSYMSIHSDPQCGLTVGHKYRHVLGEPDGFGDSKPWRSRTETAHSDYVKQVDHDHESDSPRD